MGFLSSLSAVRTPAIRAGASSYISDFFAGNDFPDQWAASLSAAGVTVTPDLALTLSAVYCAVKTISYDIATLPLNTWRILPAGGKALVRGQSQDVVKGGIGDLAYLMRWAPNDFQTATEYFVSQIAQWLLRGKAYAEIVPGPGGFLGQLLPRHPDRVFPEKLPNGRIRYKLIEGGGVPPRYLTQDEMHVVRDLSQDGVTGLSRTQYGANVFGTALAAERASGRFFKSGMTAAVMATYTGDLDDEAERALHASISRYAAGADNNFGLLLVPDDVKISNLAISPDKAQMMEARSWGVEEVARMFTISPRKLMARKDGSGYGSAFQDAIDHVVGCLRPVARTFEQAIQRDLILAKDTYFLRYDFRELLQGDPAQMADYIERLIRARALRPSEARELYLDLNPDAELDRLSENDNQPGKPANPQPAPKGEASAAQTVTAAHSSRVYLRGVLALHDSAMRCLNRERAAAEKLAKKHASDPHGWTAGLRDFYGDHATFVSETMRISIEHAREYVARHGLAIEDQGMGLLDGEAGAAWVRCEADALAALALDEAAAAA